MAGPPEANGLEFVSWAHCRDHCLPSFGCDFIFCVPGQDTTVHLKPLALIHAPKVSWVTIAQRSSRELDLCTGLCDHAVSDRDSCRRAWSVSTGQCLQLYSGHLEAVDCMCASTSGVMLSGGRDIRVWSSEFPVL